MRNLSHFWGSQGGDFGTTSRCQIYANFETLGAELFLQVLRNGSQEFADYGQFVTIDEIIDQDVLMLLRVQHERR